MAGRTRPNVPKAAGDLTLIGSLLALALLAWLVSARLMGGMTMDGRYAFGNAATFLGVWVLMMAAMMFPSVWPAVMVHRRMLTPHSTGGRVGPGRGTAFLVGYLISWTVFGAAAFAIVVVGRDVLAGLSDADVARYVVAPIGVAGAVYQAAPLKRVCLRHCRSPLFWLSEHWRDGVRGSLVMGVRHGGFCVGCCSFLMALMVAAGTMSVAWMALIAAAITIEKLAPIPAPVASGIVAAAFLTVTVVALADPSLLPGFGGEGGSMPM